MYAVRGCDPFDQNSNRSDRKKRTTSKGGPFFSKLFRLDRTDPLSFGPKFPESLVEWIASTYVQFYSVYAARSSPSSSHTNIPLAGHAVYSPQRQPGGGRGGGGGTRPIFGIGEPLRA